jgi:hypothetical protein
MYMECETCSFYEEDCVCADGTYPKNCPEYGLEIMAGINNFTLLPEDMEADER